MKRGPLLNAKDFRAALENYAKKTAPTIIKDAQVAIGRRMFQGVRLHTAVLSGHARHNWQPSVNQPTRREFEGEADVTTTGDAITGAEDAAFEAVAEQIRSMPLGQKLWISNYVPYILRLENGYSKKAPEGMARITLQETQEFIRARNFIKPTE